jgi:hypothetical protein
MFQPADHIQEVTYKHILWVVPKTLQCFYRVGNMSFGYNVEM